MVNALFIGLGRVGLRTLKYLLELEPGLHVYAVDVDLSRSSQVAKLGNVEFYAYRPDILNDLIKRCDIAITALPSANAFNVLRELVRGCVDVVDVSFIREDPYVLEPMVMDCKSVFVPDAGFAPGYSNIVVGFTQKLLNGLDSVDVMVGGIPEIPIPPLGYVITWNALDLIEEYVRVSRIVKNGVVVEVDPLSEVVEVEVEGIGRLEGFISDGLRTLLRNVKARNMRELTLRWPGHINAMKLLRDLGLMSYEELEVGGVKVIPAKVLAMLFETKLRSNVGDLAIIHVRAKGVYGGEYSETAILRGTVEEPATPNFTSLVHAYTAWLVMKGYVRSGIQPLENLYEYKEEYSNYLKSKGALIRVSIKEP